MREQFYYASLAVSILLGIAGQVTLKTAANGSATVTAQFLNPVTILGLTIYLFAAVCYIVALKGIPVSLAYPTVSVSYVIVAVLGHLLWGETFGWPQAGGLLLIGSGVLLLHQH
jgi:small multidrug resistance pump